MSPVCGIFSVPSASPTPPDPPANYSPPVPHAPSPSHAPAPPTSPPPVSAAPPESFAPHLTPAPPACPAPTSPLTKIPLTPCSPEPKCGMYSPWGPTANGLVEQEKQGGSPSQVRGEPSRVRPHQRNNNIHCKVAMKSR